MIAALIAAVAIIVGWLTAAFIPFGQVDAKRYFDAPEARQLQTDEKGQITRLFRVYDQLANTGDDFPGWNTDIQEFWKYSIAFSAYGIPSAMIIEPERSEEYRLLMDNMIWKMKSRRVWGDFTDRGFGPDPITQQNIMYKGHLNLMLGLYQLSTGDDRYGREFHWLSQQLADEMRLHHEGRYEGVTCEPNAWFVECNVVGMMSLHIHDKLYGSTFTENEVVWTLDFMRKRMRDPETGLFYRSYHPQQDVIRTDISGYANGWSIAFLNRFDRDLAQDLYDTGYKPHLLLSRGPFFAAIAGDARVDPEPNQIATLFGLLAAKEMGDVKTFGPLRNAVDHFGKLGPAEEGGLAYDSPDSVHMNGVVLAAKLHMGWDTILDHDWVPDRTLPLPAPDVSELSWRDILPSQIFVSEQARRGLLAGEPPLPVEDLSRRACPNCFWGDFRSVRMRAADTARQCDVPTGDHVAGSCNLDALDKALAVEP